MLFHNSTFLIIFESLLVWSVIAKADLAGFLPEEDLWGRAHRLLGATKVLFDHTSSFTHFRMLFICIYI
jgi:hypothetical protein